MIVCDEEHVIERCLRSAAPFITTYCICYNGTGSGKTKDIIRKVMYERNIKGVIHDHTWEEFGPTRTKAFQASREHCPNGWSWVIDADDTIVGDPPSEQYWSNIPENVTHMNVKIEHGALRHHRPQLFRNSFEWKYKRRIHETPVLDDVPNVVLTLPETVRHVVFCEGVRSLDPLKYIKDANRAKLDYLDDPKDGRSIYYLAQCYRDAQLYGESIKWYKLRAEIGDQARHEQYLACVEIIYHAVDIKEQLRYTWKALDIDGTRLEAPGWMLGIAVTKNHFTSEVLAIGNYVKQREPLPEHIFTNMEIYDWKYADSFSVVLFWKGLYAQSLAESRRALLKCPEGHRERIGKNVQYAYDKLHPKK